MTHHELEELLPLRLALESSAAATRTAGKYRRGAAIVALDAVVERTLVLASLRRGWDVPRDAKFDPLLAQVKEGLGDAWPVEVEPAIRKLRRARNSAQHEALEPDREQMAGWASAVEILVHAVIEAIYGVDVRRVSRMEAIRREDLREQLTRAEQDLLAGELDAAVHHAADAYRNARRLWAKASGVALQSVASRSLRDVLGFDDVPETVSPSELDDLWFAAAFASNVADSAWLRGAFAHRSWGVLDADEAARAISVVFGIIVRLEEALENWVPDRFVRARRASRRVRADNVPASIAEVLTVERSADFKEGAWTVEFVLRDVPPSEDFDAWAQCLRERLDPAWSVGSDGTVRRVGWMVDADEGVPTPAEIVATLVSALDAVEGDLERADLAAAARETGERRKAAALQQIEEIRSELPWWARRVSVDPGMHEPTGDRLDFVLSIAPELTAEYDEVASTLVSALEEREVKVSPTDYGPLVIENVTVQELVDHLQAISHIAAPIAETIQRRAEEAERAQRIYREQLEAAMRELSTDNR